MQHGGRPGIGAGQFIPLRAGTQEIAPLGGIDRQAKPGVILLFRDQPFGHDLGAQCLIVRRDIIAEAPHRLDHGVLHHSDRRVVWIVV